MTLARAFRTTVAEHPDRVAVRTKDDEVSWTWSELAERVDALAGGLAALGVRRGDTVALLLSNRPEFHVADLAVATLGATPFSIYATFTREQIEYVVSDAGARVGLIEAQFADRFPALEHVLALEDGWPSEPGFDPEPHWRAIEPDDLVTLIYTSGTTGPPKGVQLTHRNVMATIETTRALIEFPAGAKVISWLPAAHIAERMANHYLPVAVAMTITCCPDPRAIAAYLPAVRPTWFFAVPRIWEKLKAGLESFLLQGEDAERNREWLEAATRKVEHEQAREPVPDELAATVEEADRELFAGLRAMLGLDEVVAVYVGAAPTPRDVLVFFHAIGIPVAELWGLSESCGAGCCNPPAKIKIGTVGPPAPGIEVRLGDDGELLVRSETADDRLPQRARQDRRGARRRRLAAHRRHRRDRRRRLRPDRRPQEGDHHQRRRQEHVALEHRVGLEGSEPADRAGVRDRRRAPLQHGADRARLRLRTGVGGPAGDRRAPTWRRWRTTSGCGRRSRRASTTPTRSSGGWSRSRSSRSWRGTGSPAATSSRRP